MAGGLVPCSATRCANAKFHELTGKYHCIALDCNMLDPNVGTCPFFVERSKAEQARKDAAKRAESLGLLVNGVYPGPHFTRTVITEDENGKINAEVVADNQGWLQNLADRGIIPQARVDGYREAN